MTDPSTGRQAVRAVYVEMIKVCGAFLAIIMLSFAAFFTILPTYFLSDDFYLIARVARQGLFYTWGGFLRPGTVLSFLINYRLSGFEPLGYHVTNVGFHALAGCALFVVCRQLLSKVGLPSARMFAFLCACLFTVLSCHSEPVSWISGRTDVIAVCLGLWATAGFLHLMEKASWRACFWPLLLLWGALLTKESVAVLPVVWGLLYGHHVVLFKRCPTHKASGVLLLSFVSLGAWFLWRKALLGQFVGGYGTELHTSFFHVATLHHLARYVFRTLSPALPLRCYPWRFYGLVGTVVLMLCLAFAVLFLARKRGRGARPWITVGMLSLCYLTSLVPVVTIPIYFFSTREERYLYLPSAFACMTLVVVVGVLTEKRRRSYVLLGGLILAQFSALQWVNLRWVEAARMSQQIAREAASAGSENILVLNVPDNYQGAYVYRNGLHYAATLFLQNKTPGANYRWVSTHSYASIHQTIDAEVTGPTISAVLPAGLTFYAGTLREYPYTISGPVLSVSIPEHKLENGLTILSFRSGDQIPMLQKMVIPPR